MGVILKIYLMLAAFVGIASGWMTGKLTTMDALILVAVALLLMPPLLLFHGAS